MCANLSFTREMQWTRKQSKYASLYLTPSSKINLAAGASKEAISYCRVKRPVLANPVMVADSGLTIVILPHQCWSWLIVDWPLWYYLISVEAGLLWTDHCGITSSVLNLAYSRLAIVILPHQCCNSRNAGL